MTRYENEEGTEQQANSGWGKSGWGQHGFTRAQFGQRGWLRPAILRLLEEKPMNGMEIINRFTEVSHGWWRPSPGSVYPLLEQLEGEGLIEKKGDGRYKTTTKFSAHKEPQGQTDEMIANLEGTVSYLEELAQGDRKQLSEYKGRIAKVVQRLSKLK